MTYWYGLTDIQAAAVHATAEAMGRGPGELAEELLPLLRMDAPDVPIDPEYAEEVLPEELEEIAEPDFPYPLATDAAPADPETVAVPVVKPDLNPPTTEMTAVKPPLDPPTDEIPVTTNPLPVAKKEAQ